MPSIMRVGKRKPLIPPALAKPSKKRRQPSKKGRRQTRKAMLLIIDGSPEQLAAIERAATASGESRAVWALRALLEAAKRGS